MGAFCLVGPLETPSQSVTSVWPPERLHTGRWEAGKRGEVSVQFPNRVTPPTPATQASVWQFLLPKMPSLSPVLALSFCSLFRGHSPSVLSPVWVRCPLCVPTPAAFPP